MNILIVSATYLEIEPLLLKFDFLNEENQKLKQYQYKGHRIDVLIPGVGMTVTAFWLGKTLGNNYDIALNLGLAGSFNDSMQLGEVIHITSDRFSELGAEDGESFLSLIDMDLIEDDDYPLNHGELENTLILKNKVIQTLRTAKAITVNTVHGDDDSINKIKNTLNPDVESMEGAAFFYGCLALQVPFAQIRSISNKVEKRNPDNWDIPLAVKNLCEKSLQIINSL